MSVEAMTEHPQADAIDKAMFNHLMLDEAYRKPSRPTHETSDIKRFHVGYSDGPRGLVLDDLRIGDVVQPVHDCGPPRLRHEYPPVAIAAIRWYPGHGVHLVQVIDADWTAGWTHAGDLGLERYGHSYTTVDATEGSPTYMTEIPHPMCGRWSASNYSQEVAP